jgi:hypothetical protein
LLDQGSLSVRGEQDLVAAKGGPEPRARAREEREERKLSAGFPSTPPLTRRS